MAYGVAIGYEELGSAFCPVGGVYIRCNSTRSCVMAYFVENDGVNMQRTALTLVVRRQQAWVSLISVHDPMCLDYLTIPLRSHQLPVCVDDGLSFFTKLLALPQTAC